MITLIGGRVGDKILETERTIEWWEPGTENRQKRGVVI